MPHKWSSQNLWEAEKTKRFVGGYKINKSGLKYLVGGSYFKTVISAIFGFEHIPHPTTE